MEVGVNCRCLQLFFVVGPDHRVVHGYDFVEVLEPGSFALHVDGHQPADGPTLATSFTNTRRGPPSRVMKYPTRAW